MYIKEKIYSSSKFSQSPLALTNRAASDRSLLSLSLFSEMVFWKLIFAYLYQRLAKARGLVSSSRLPFQPDVWQPHPGTCCPRHLRNQGHAAKIDPVRLHLVYERNFARIHFWRLIGYYIKSCRNIK